ncbi:MAG: ATP-binding protein [Planctomycetota bacterium]
MIKRPSLEKAIERGLERNPVVSLLGPRQCGKTTLARIVARGRKSTFFDLENPKDLAQLESPMLGLEGLEGLVVIDEIQRRPDLFPVLRVLADRPDARAKFLVLGSASPDLVKGVSESLAGRVGIVEMGGIDLEEAGTDRFEALWNRGGFPRSFLARTDEASLEWREDFIRTFLERDLAALGIGSVPSPALRRFWTMISHFHGQIWNAAEFARALGASEPTARRYLDILSAAFVVRVLPPWFQNISKRQVKAPKIYVRDSGILHALLSIETKEALMGHGKCGASFEGFVVEQAISSLKPADAYFWAAHTGAELDLLLFLKGKRVGIEVKLTDAPGTTKSMHAARTDLRLDRLLVVHAGERSFPLQDGIEAVSVRDMVDALAG